MAGVQAHPTCREERTKMDIETKTTLRMTSMVKLGFKLTVLVAFMVTGAMFSSYGYYEYASEEQTCLKCHSQRNACDRWALMAHDWISCKSCHDGAMNCTMHSLTQSFHLALHPDTAAEAIDSKLDEGQMLAINENCRNCHAAEYDEWTASGHAATYADIFLDKQHNADELLADRCLVCHGMFFDGNVADLVTPLDTEGPWKLCKPVVADWPSIPCFACHQIHAKHYPSPDPDYSDPVVSQARPRDRSTRLDFYSRYGGQYFSAEDLHAITLSDGEEALEVSNDARQRVCFQCHSPNSFHQSETSDDRTPTGVHQGLSCFECHSSHGGTRWDSCSACHKSETEELQRQKNPDYPQGTIVHEKREM
jgi:hypothetical protein